MPKLACARIALGLVCVAIVPGLVGCSSPSQWTLTIDKVGPEYVPPIAIDGVIQRIAAVTICGSPELTAPLLARLQGWAWKARLASQDCIEVDPVGHSLDEVTALNFRVENGEFGDLKFKVVMREDRKATARAQAH
jgi:hypothetical protein